MECRIGARKWFVHAENKSGNCPLLDFIISTSTKPPIEPMPYIFGWLETHMLCSISEQSVHTCCASSSPSVSFHMVRKQGAATTTHLIQRSFTPPPTNHSCCSSKDLRTPPYCNDYEDRILLGSDIFVLHSSLSNLLWPRSHSCGVRTRSRSPCCHMFLWNGTYLKVASQFPTYLPFDK